MSLLFFLCKGFPSAVGLVLRPASRCRVNSSATNPRRVPNTLARSAWVYRPHKRSTHKRSYLIHTRLHAISRPAGWISIKLPLVLFGYKNFASLFIYLVYFLFIPIFFIIVIIPIIILLVQGSSLIGLGHTLRPGYNSANNKRLRIAAFRYFQRSASACTAIQHTCIAKAKATSASCSQLLFAEVSHSHQYIFETFLLAVFIFFITLWRYTDRWRMISKEKEVKRASWKANRWWVYQECIVSALVFSPHANRLLGLDFIRERKQS